MTGEVNADIEVVAQFTSRGLCPRIFTWKKRRYVVNRVTASWVERESAYRRYLFAVQTDDANVYELCFDAGKMLWRLLRIHCD